jgi:hypothetical protein
VYVLGKGVFVFMARLGSCLLGGEGGEGLRVVRSVGTPT